MLFRKVQTAPTGSTWARAAFLPSLGQMLPLKIEGVTVGSATLLGAIPIGERRRSVQLVWEVDELDAAVYAETSARLARHPSTDAVDASLPFDEFVPPLAFNTAAALEIVRLAEPGNHLDFGSLR